MAELTLTDDDTLNAGVVLMARPPGKKNSSISQLSGGKGVNRSSFGICDI